MIFLAETGRLAAFILMKMTKEAIIAASMEEM
ncbi:hypothetical protein JOC77_001557 [Peribacillus deserti]|uniref:Uncharacterized protein n=1 Tax=Peribacillus deserti TaxID=673318 RepID=A0ABS2QGH0_9BACI|nr:hypothetical protein [Peribacillus deserti]